MSPRMVTERLKHLAARMPPFTIVVVALLLRVAWVVACSAEPISDQFAYHQAAVNLALGHGYVDTDGAPANYWPVGYPALLAPFYRAFGPHGGATATWVNVGLGMLLVLGVHRLGRELFGDVAGRWAAAITAVYPTFVLYTTCVASENAFMPAVVWLIYASVRMGRSSSLWPWAIVVGALGAAAAHIRATIALTLVLVPLAPVLWHVPWRQWLPRTAVAAGVCAILLVPWSLRNQAYVGKFTPLSLNGSANLWMGNHDGSDGGYAPLPPETQGMGLVARERYLGEKANQFIRSHPLDFIRLSALRVWKTLRSDTIGVVWNIPGITARFGERAITPFKVLTTAAHYCLLLAAVVAFTLLLRDLARRWRADGFRSLTRVPGSWLLVAHIVAMAIPFVFIVSGNRYHLPAAPIALTFTIGTLAQLEFRPPAPESEADHG